MDFLSKAQPKSFPQKSPVKVQAMQFKESKAADFEPVVHRSPYPGRYPGGLSPTGPVENAEFIFHGTDDMIWPVEDGDWIVFVEGKVFPSYVALGRGHSFVMSDADFNHHFGEKKPPATKESDPDFIGPPRPKKKGK